MSFESVTMSQQLKSAIEANDPEAYARGGLAVDCLPERAGRFQIMRSNENLCCGKMQVVNWARHIVRSFNVNSCKLTIPASHLQVCVAKNTSP